MQDVQDFKIYFLESDKEKIAEMNRTLFRKTNKKYKNSHKYVNLADLILESFYKKDHFFTYFDSKSKEVRILHKLMTADQVKSLDLMYGFTVPGLKNVAEFTEVLINKSFELVEDLELPEDMDEEKLEQVLNSTRKAFEEIFEDNQDQFSITMPKSEPQPEEQING